MQKEKKNQNTLHRTLTSSMLNMITIGGSIGTGIFLASGNALYQAGPGGLMIAYLITGAMAYFLITSLCEMAAYMPSTGSFYIYASRFVDPALGYALGWNYWYSWSVTVASEISAASLVMHYWLPNSPSFIWCGLFLFIVVGFNALSAKAFGAAEYWFSFIKITVIILFIAIGIAIACGATQFAPVGLTNWKTGDAPFHGGYISILSALMIAGFSFQGTELIGITAGESKNPRTDIPKAVKQIILRILIFFLASIFIITLLVPHTSIALAESNATTSPFTFVFSQYGLTYAASIINLVVLIAILSAGNSGIYAASRMLWYLAKDGHVPKLFSTVNHRGIPMNALIATTLVAMLAFLSSFFGNGTVYFWLLNAGSLSGFIAWMGIAISHYRFRQAYLKQGNKLEDLPYVAKAYPYGPLIVFALCIIIVGGQNIKMMMSDHINWFGVLVSYIGIPAFLFVWMGYKFFYRTKIIKLNKCNLLDPNLQVSHAINS